MYIKYSHIVQVHPVELGEPNTYKVVREEEFAEKDEALRWIKDYNLARVDETQAVYRGCVNNETGELI